MSRLIKAIYQFDLEGTLIAEFPAGLKEASEKTSISVSCIKSAVVKNRCVDSHYYFSYHKNFSIEEERYSHNPLFSKAKYFANHTLSDNDEDF